MKRIVEKSFLRLAISGVLTCLLFLSNISPGAVNAQTAWQPDSRLEAAILKEDWPQVAALLGSDKNLAAPARLVKAHAYLALNRNNESLCLFLNADSKADLEKWEEWTRSFASKKAKAVIAHYFRGDALARLEKWDTALAAFNQALETQANHPLSLNARGVVYVTSQQWDEALLDFDDATQANPSFADAYANRGVLNIQKKDGADGALKAFGRALEISPDFALALNGRAGIKVVLGEWDEAEASFRKVGVYSTGCLSALSEVTTLNLDLLAYSKSEAVTKAVAKIAKNEPGMSTTRTVVPKEDVGKLKWVLGDSIAKTTQRQNALPDKAGGNLNASLSFSHKTIGPVPVTEIKGQVGVGGNAQWNIRNRFDSQINSLKGNLDHLNKQYPDVQPVKPNVVDRFLTGWKYRDMTGGNPAGVSTEGIGEARIDKGDWQVATWYGLFYSMRPKSDASNEKER